MKRPLIHLILYISFMVVITGCSNSPTSSEQSSSQQQYTSAPNLTGTVVYHHSIGDSNQIYKVDLTSGVITQLTNEGDNIEPSWSPDGNKIVYSCRDAEKIDLCVMDQDGSNKSKLLTNGYKNWGARWSPDGKTILYVSNEIQFSHIHILDLETGNNHRLLIAEGNEGSPKWSSDGKKIVYMSDRGSLFNLYTIDPDGKKETQITDFGYDDRPSWSPDGTKIVLRRELKPSSVFAPAELIIIDADGSNEVQLSDNILSEDWPSFSPDGEWIIYSTNKDQGVQLVVIPSSGGTPASLISGGIYGNAPDWKP